MWNLKYDTNNRSTKQKSDPTKLEKVENWLVAAKREESGGWRGGIGSLQLADTNYYK